VSEEPETSGMVLPENWKWAELGELALFINGDRGKNYPSQSNRVDSGVPFINTGHIDPNGRLSGDRMDYIARETFEKLGSGKVKAGDILYCLRGSTIGKIARNEFSEGAIASSLIIIRAGKPALQSFIYHYLASPIGQTLARKFDNGSAQPNLSARVLSKYPIPVPSDAELPYISQLLDALDDKIELNRRMNLTLETIARAIFKDWFVDFGPTRAKIDGSPPYLAQEIWALFPGSLGDGGIPEEWKIGTLGDAARQVGQSVSPEALDPETPYIGLEHMPRHSIALTDWAGAGKVTSGKLAFRKGDLLFGKLRPYFHKVGIAPLDGICSTDIVVLNARERNATAFVLACISQDDFVAFTDRTSDGTKMPRTSWGRME